MKIALLCGGPSLERGISLNSARSVLDHLEDEDLEIIPIYFDYRKNAYRISKAQLYSNTPSDFAFKLQQTSLPLGEAALITLLRKVDIAFPVMHGRFGEDGEIQRFLEKHKIPFIGSSSATCKLVFDKFTANEFIKNLGFFVLPSVVLKIFHDDHQEIIESFFKTHHLSQAIVKPARGGSSIGVFSVSTPEEALSKARVIFSKRMDTRVVVEPFAEGREFTVIILESRFGLPVAILPTEIETDYTKHQIFDFRKKYLPTRQVTYHCPPRFNDETIEKIQTQAEQIFSTLGMRDFGRFDGWVLDSGKIWFSDFNPISGMEQNSFLFQQASRVGLTHRGVLRYILRQACRRYGIPFPQKKNEITRSHYKKRVNIVFGGNTSERQVSLMSGTNVWLKLRKSAKYEPKPFLLDTEGYLWALPYSLALNHTVEEIAESCKKARHYEQRLFGFEKKAKLRLALSELDDTEDYFEPKKMKLEELIKISQFVFIALHGGDGENGSFQKLLRAGRVKFNGPAEEVSQLCMDKQQTSEFIKNLGIKGVRIIPRRLIKTKELFKLDEKGFRELWHQLRRQLGAKAIIVKPRADGCSSGVVNLKTANELKEYINLTRLRVPFIPQGIFKNQRDRIEMPLGKIEELLFEKFIETDTVRVKGNQLKHYRKTGWLEITVGVIEEDKSLKVLNPSITIAESQVLSVEEKFQGGTGINITPPPPAIVKKRALKKTKQLMGKVAQKIGIKGYSRIDAFMHRDRGEIMIIEINTLPGLTPSTVLYHQALAERPSIFPRELLEKLIENKNY